jgi:hypothetical protein
MTLTRAGQSLANPDILIPPVSLECRPEREAETRLGYRFGVSITTLLRTTPAGRLRAAVRSGAVAAMTSVPLLAVTTALADTSNHTYDGEDSGSGLTVLQTIGIYIGIPLGLFLLITFLVCLPGWVRGDRNRREVGWVEPPAGGSGAAGGAKSSAEQAVHAGRQGGTGGASGSW